MEIKTVVCAIPTNNLHYFYKMNKIIIAILIKKPKKPKKMKKPKKKIGVTTKMKGVDFRTKISC